MGYVYANRNIFIYLICTYQLIYTCFNIGFQIYDFFGDIFFTYHLFILWTSIQDLLDETKPKSQDDDMKTKAFVAMILAFASLGFIVFPYLLNLCFAGMIKKYKIIKENKCALNYFSHNPTIFIILTVFSGSVYTSLGIVSSKIFGLMYYNSGLTKHEMNKLTSIKLKSTVLCENLPQMLIQIVNFIYFGFDEPAIIAFVGSLLSVILSVLVWFVNRETDELYPVIYYIEFGKRITKLSDNEKKKFRELRMLRKGLRLKICKEIYNIASSTIQLGNISVTDNGVIIRFIHFVDVKDVLTLRSKISGHSNQSRSNSRSNRDKRGSVIDDIVSGFDYTEQLFETHKVRLIKTLFDFYKLNNVSKLNEFDAIYHKEFPLYINTDKYSNSFKNFSSLASKTNPINIKPSQYGTDTDGEIETMNRIENLEMTPIEQMTSLIDELRKQNKSLKQQNREYKSKLDTPSKTNNSNNSNNVVIVRKSFSSNDQEIDTLL